MRKQCNIPEWNKNGSLVFASRTVDRPIFNANELSTEELNMITVELVKNMIKQQKQIV